MTMPGSSIKLTQSTSDAATEIQNLYQKLANEIVTDPSGPDMLALIKLADLPFPQLEDDEPVALSDAWAQIADKNNVRLRTYLVSKLVDLSRGHAESYQKHSQSAVEKPGDGDSASRRGVQAGLTDYLSFLETRSDFVAPFEFTFMDWDTRSSKLQQRLTATDLSPFTETTKQEKAIVNRREKVQFFAETVYSLTKLFEQLCESQTKESTQ